MSIFSKPFLRVAAGIGAMPNHGPFIASNIPVQLGMDISSAEDSLAGFSERIIFGAASQEAVVDSTGNTSLSANGQRQVDTATITAPAGATANGNLLVIVTKSGMGSSPLAINVPLRSNIHTTATLIAAAIRDALNANANVASVMEALETSDATVMVRSIYPAANDATLNINIAAGLGVTAAPTSANTLEGIAGVVAERPGMQPMFDPLGYPYPAHTSMQAIVVKHRAGSAVTCAKTGQINPNDMIGRTMSGTMSADVTFTATGPAILDVLVLTA